MAAAVKKILFDRGITVQQFADTIGHPNATVARWINQGGSFSVDALGDMAEGLGMEANDLTLLARASETEFPALLREIEKHHPAPAIRKPARRRAAGS